MVSKDSNFLIFFFVFGLYLKHFHAHIIIILKSFDNDKDSNLHMTQHTNYLSLILVVIWASIGIVAEKASDATVPDSTKNLVYAILGLTCVLLVLRIVIVVIRQLKRPLGKSGISQISDKPAY